MRFLLMHRLDESAPEWNPGQEFVEEVGAFVQEAAEQGVLLTGEGVHPSEKGARVRKTADAGITTTDGPFSEAKEVIGGFLVINAKDRAEAVAFAERYAAMFQDVEIEVRQVVEEEDLP
ncbi:YciI family protein [Allokutzneria sp. A3M-2-11 16]|uniref:YciI family protein n=1 Tax=Allokutzneria sp. A3M-2-11 16 TaxID=2962043 RepID=UPI0020B6F77D|nr:YciI family protein [Allokutzneria sp. A3M-2-11 16]MCP3801383.1 YciI family protein [Allokutzneria sp. A3M-2-11 16]